jgi:hypothetical protein
MMISARTRAFWQPCPKVSLRSLHDLCLVLGVVYRTISSHLLAEANLTRATGATGAVTLVQRFGSALNLNVHFHMIFPDGV